MKKQIFILFCLFASFNTLANNLNLIEREKMVVKATFDADSLCSDTSITANHTQQSKKQGITKETLLSKASNQKQKKVINVAYDIGVKNIEQYTQKVYKTCIIRLRDNLLN